ncbi:hypothetical protein R6Q59_013949 [Mikania micrantha]|uniref:Knr4/Smi1-like domain-containing protein n=1 Tax=Mikania micrantha TaxID=192012 RepID=A0A5N6P6Q0_9ASTR|nr:hypothetical protein E3N88_12398 [Mikania micrantha]
MAATTATPPPVNWKTRPCFSFAAYSKDLIAHLHHHCNVPVAHGLTQTELSTIESNFNFSFPPDLRSILREGLPVGRGFPDWRSSSPQQLDILVNLPILGLCKDVSRKRFWYRRWGDRPEEDDDAVKLAKGFLKRSPVLVPVYQNCYISTVPCLSGNPVFYVNGSEIKVCSYDVIGLFHQIEFKDGVVSGMRLGHFLNPPVWAASEARRIQFWTELTEIRCVEPQKRWWGARGKELGWCLEGVRLKLRDGGWKEAELDEMMVVEANDTDDSYKFSSVSQTPSSLSMSSSSSNDDGDNVNKVMSVWEDRKDFVRILSQRLLRGGWSMRDVVESLGCLTGNDRTVESENGGGGESSIDFEHMSHSCVHDGQSEVIVGVENTR